MTPSISATPRAAARQRVVARYGGPQGRVARLILIGAVPPLMLKTSANLTASRRVFDGLRKHRR